MPSHDVHSRGGIGGRITYTARGHLWLVERELLTESNAKLLNQSPQLRCVRCGAVRT